MKSIEDWKKEYEQDDFCGTEFNTPKGGVLTVVGIAGRFRGGIKKYACHCSICHKDGEMFPDLETIEKYCLVKQHSVPCACSKTYHWNDRQYRLRIKRMGAYYDIISKEEITGIMQKVKLQCINDGNEWEAIVSNLLQGSGCPVCNKQGGYSPKKSGVFYVVHWHKSDSEFLKYGITNKGIERITGQHTKTDYKPTVLFLGEFTDGSIAPELERECDARRNELYGFKGVVSKEEFEDGYTETMNVDQYEWLNNLLFENTMCRLEAI
ncbi:TPA: hypothetical protein RQN15_002202 [Aeromonas hydrophila]|nr:hypothetical protein [Aeromonas hydrophila]